MAVSPVNIARVSYNLRSANLLRTVQGSQLGLFRTQNQLATGLRFQTPSEDPVRAARATRLDGKIDILKNVQGNLDTANASLREGEQAMQDAVDLVRQAYNVASEAASDSISTDERKALVTVIDSLLEQSVAVGNRTHLGQYLFSGLTSAERPFELTDDSVRFHGDDGRRNAILDSDLSQDAFTISGLDFFGSGSQRVVGSVDLDPMVALDTRLRDLDGATSSGIDTGRMLISDGTTSIEVDISGADTVGDVIDLLNDQMPSTLDASLGGSGIQISSSSVGPVNITVADMAGGTTSVKLGINATTPQPSIIGLDLNAKLTPRTRIVQLLDGSGIDLNAGIRIRMGSETANVDFTGVETMEDVINRINATDLGVHAEISPDGTALNVTSRVSGVDMSIEENGGTVASALGIRTLHGGARLADLNDGDGVTTVEGDDIRIVTADGSQIDVDLDDIDVTNGTLADVIGLLNTAGGGRITASLSSSGGGVLITDNTAGGGTLQIQRLNVSPALDWLGLAVSPTGNQLVGSDVYPVRVDSVFTGMLELREALNLDDPQLITRAGERIDRTLQQMQKVQGELAAKAQVMLRRTDRIDDESTFTTTLLSDVKDVDLTEAIVRFQQIQTALEANLSTSQRILGLSLFDYL
ncbi:MAG: hypothetical protein ACKVS9_18775 [Phycisphaerae bacterium]